MSSSEAAKQPKITSLAASTETLPPKCRTAEQQPEWNSMGGAQHDFETRAEISGSVAGAGTGGMRVLAM